MSNTILRDLRSVFGRHQTFPPRYTWIKNAYDAVACPARNDDSECVERGDAFTRNDIHRELGVGKNQARSMRFWAEASGTLTENEADSSRLPVLRSTRFGQFLLSSDHGHDPWLEATESWWLLHWQFVSPRSMLPAWWVAFHSFQPISFTAESLHEHILPYLNGAGHDPAESVLRRDVLAMLRTYTTSSAARTKVDDDIDLPMARLGLLRETADGFRFSIGPKAGLASEVAAFAMLDFMEHENPGSERVLIGAAALEAGGPGRAFKLTERDLSALLSDAAETYPELLVIDRSAAAEQFIVVGPSIQEVAVDLLRGMYARLDLLPPTKPADGWATMPTENVRTGLLGAGADA